MDNNTNNTNNTEIWVEKYRPTTLSNIVYSDNTINTILKKYVEMKNIPHLLLSGPSGVGKTSTIIAIAKELFPGDLYEKRVTILNASDERGIGIVRNKILPIASSYIPCVPNVPYFKLIIFDEADAMTGDAQRALRRLIELYSLTTRFCFICNYKHKIIRAIESRCAHIEFPQLDIKSGLSKLVDIAKMENMKIKSSYLTIVMNESHGDLRKAISLLQNISYVYKFKTSEKFGKNDIMNVCNIVPDSTINTIIKFCSHKKTKIVTLNKLAFKLIYMSYILENLIIKLVDTIRESTKIKDKIKSNMIILLTESYMATNMGVNNYVCLLDLLLKLTECFRSE